MYLSPPLPFNGNKRFWSSYLYETFKNIKLDKSVIIIDIFGGSGLLSHVFASIYPDNTVIYNDYDYYTKLLNDKMIDKINEFIQYGNKLCEKYNIKQEEKLPRILHDKIYNKIKTLFGDEFENNNKLRNIIFANIGYRSRIHNIELDFYNNFKSSTYKYVRNYLLPNIKVIHKDYRDIIIDYSKYPVSKIFYIIDPPYLTPEKSYYENFWGLTDTCNIISICMKYKCILFEAIKSEILPLLEFIKKISYIKFNYVVSDEKKLSVSDNTEYYILFNFKTFH
jgi:hypothetical protein